jgi:hypothetical protein
MPTSAKWSTPSERAVVTPARSGRTAARDIGADVTHV